MPTLRLSFKESGQPISPIRYRKDGVHLPGEKDALPRWIAVSIAGRDQRAKSYLRERKDGKRWKLEHEGAGDTLDITLGNGTYLLRPRIERMDVSPSELPIAILGENREVEFSLREKDQRSIELTRPISKFPKHMRAVIEASKIESTPLGEWLPSSVRRARRQACFLNILASLHALELSEDIQSSFLVDIDRIYCKVKKSFVDKVSASAEFSSPSRPRHPIHKKLLERVVGHELDDAAFDEVGLKSVRHHARPSLQAVYYKGDQGQHYAELDLDLGSPLTDLAGVVIHLGELLNRGRTDHLNLHDDLAGDAEISPFLFYRTIE